MTTPTWFITGASSGFGMAFARYALSRGYNVVATARTPAKLEQIRQIAPDRVLIEKLDVTVSGDADKAAAAAISRFGAIDVLFNNAGYGIVGALEETPEGELRSQMETNFFGAVAVTKAVLPEMRKQRSGAIVNISSLGGQLSFGGFSAYSASKFALEGMSEALAQEVAPFGIKVLIVEPGAFRTGFAADALKHMPVMDAYRDIVGGTRAFAQGMHGTQQGDPAKAAEAIESALNAETTPLRLPLGADSVEAVRAHAEQLLKDLKTWERVALDTRIYPEVA
ncbi:NAD(P)-dependent dehydrogenase (short-subunit alcohol dehydrogenase family) [Paraburkholderia bannensis]|uniref:NAD(P)-dependent dehydrogenase (Short-subunit alcohol dehydrogenase family) n=1 Tax=Paraburkholderia bannensis TaxID=765414 RepID=A0A7W9TZR0_9BURK|nr:MULTISPECIES: oxidoreductase [Paraburkholderia]MBB3258657.1 NAD(P)-dependent dehydrogenase (short-subunit alcohol dehydrogenase family) [Paraburkholderia sp. WP4_3_2]MBB6103671.1 NAD(P)-dependent dehydrogenase (short-subunit alcohol dehydrogenase family) [Paraburkholderia bannensis]